MNIESMICPDCGTYPSNLIVIDCYDKELGHYPAFECRDCGDYWEELPDVPLVGFDEESI